MTASDRPADPRHVDQRFAGTLREAGLPRFDSSFHNAATGEREPA